MCICKHTVLVPISSMCAGCKKKLAAMHAFVLHHGNSAKVMQNVLLDAVHLVTSCTVVSMVRQPQSGVCPPHNTTCFLVFATQSVQISCKMKATF